MQSVGYSEARENLKKVMAEAVADRAPVPVARQRGENAVMMSADERAGREETLHEPLHKNLSGWWSRRISGGHRLVYPVRGTGEAQAVEVLSCRYPY